MVKARNVLRADAACHSADVLTPTERAAEKFTKGFMSPQQLVFCDRACKWGDDPVIREALLKLKGVKP